VVRLDEAAGVRAQSVPDGRVLRQPGTTGRSSTAGITRATSAFDDDGYMAIVGRGDVIRTGGETVAAGGRGRARAPRRRGSRSSACPTPSGADRER
jgi:hypothetical protein